MRIAVFGASGTVGSALLPILAREHEVIAVSRRAHAEGGANVRWVTADVANSTNVHRALERVDVVVYLVHSLGHADFAARDRRAASIVARAAAGQDVHQIVYLGGLGDEADDLSEHLQSRRDTERHLASGSVPVTTIRAGMVVGPRSAAFDTILALVDRLPGMICPRWVSTPTQPIAITDIARYIAGVCGNSEAVGQTYDAGGPEVMTYRQMIERIARIRHRHPIIIEVPFLTPRLSSLWLRLVTPVQASVARPLIDGLRNPTVAHDNRLQTLVPFELTSFDTAARAAITAARPHDRSERAGVISFLCAISVGRRRRWLVFGVALVLIAVAAPLGTKFQNAQQNDPSAFLPAGAESVRSLDQQRRFPSGAETPAVTVFHRDGGLTAADRQAIAAFADQLDSDPVAHSRQTSPPLPSHDGTSAARGHAVGRVGRRRRADLGGG